MLFLKSQCRMQLLWGSASQLEERADTTSTCKAGATMNKSHRIRTVYKHLYCNNNNSSVFRFFHHQQCHFPASISAHELSVVGKPEPNTGAKRTNQMVQNKFLQAPDRDSYKKYRLWCWQCLKNETYMGPFLTEVARIWLDFPKWYYYRIYSKLRPRNCP